MNERDTATNGFIEIKPRPKKIPDETIKDVYREDLVKAKEEMLEDLKQSIEGGLQFEIQHPVEDKVYKLNDFIKVVKAEANQYDFESVLIELVERIIQKYDTEIQPRTMDLFRRIYEVMTEHTIVIDKLKGKCEEVNFTMETIKTDNETLREQNKKLKAKVELLEGKGVDELLEFVVDRSEELNRTISILFKREIDNLVGQVKTKQSIIDGRINSDSVTAKQSLTAGNVPQQQPRQMMPIADNRMHVAPNEVSQDDADNYDDEDDGIDIKEYGRK